MYETFLLCMMHQITHQKMFDNKMSVYVFDDTIVVKNKKNLQKQFPRCGITKIESFVLDMVKNGHLDELLY